MKYNKVESLEDDDSDRGLEEVILHGKISPPSKPPRFSRISCALLAENALIILIFLTLWKVFSPPPTNLYYQTLTPDNKSYPTGPLSWSQKFTPLPCGKTPEEALARGCKFDMLVTAWLPPRCIDYELVDEFMAVGNWQFYKKLHGTEEDKFGSYNPEFLGSVNRTIYTTRRWHITHCLYMFKKLNRALVNGWIVDGESVSEPHTEHCMDTFLQEDLFGPVLDPDEIQTYLEIIYPPC
jgi:hypothetical protein